MLNVPDIERSLSFYKRLRVSNWSVRDRPLSSGDGPTSRQAIAS
jgi:hypothetical protein